MNKFRGVNYIEDRDEFEKKRESFFKLAKIPDDVKSLHYKNEAAQKVNHDIHFARTGNDPSRPRVGEARTINEAIEKDGRLIFGTDEKVLVESVEPAELFFIEGYQCTLCGINTESVFVPASFQVARARLKELLAEGNRLNRMHKVEPTPKNGQLRRRAWVNYYALKNALVDLRLSYACTIHKSQGSTYNTVFIDLAEIGTCTVPKTIARLLYVAISRARDSVYITGELPERLASFNREVNF